MIRSDRYLTKPDQYERVHGQGRSWANGPVVLKVLPNGLPSSRYGFSVGSRVGNAVTRNKVKRRLREILRSKTLAPGWDIVLIARPSAAQSDYHALLSSVKGLLGRAGISSNEGGDSRPAGQHGERLRER